MIEDELVGNLLVLFIPSTTGERADTWIVWSQSMHTTYYILVVLVAVLQGVFLTGVLNLTLSVRKLS